MPTSEEMARWSSAAGVTNPTLTPYQGYDEALGTSGVSFLDRAKLSTADNDGARRAMLTEMGYEVAPTSTGQLGVVAKRPSGRSVIEAVDVENVPEMGDIADVAGDIPGIAASVGAGVATSGMGWIPALLAQFATGTGVDYARQATAQGLGSGQEPSLLKAGVMGAVDMAGEGIGRPLSRGIGGPFADDLLEAPAQGSGILGRVGRMRGREPKPQAPDATNIVNQFKDIDTRFGSNLEGMAPIDATTGSPSLQLGAENVRKSPGGRQTFLKEQDVPWWREQERTFDTLVDETGAAGPPGTKGPYAQRAAGEGIPPTEAAGDRLHQAAKGTMAERRTARGEAYDEFEALVDPADVPDLTNTQKAIQEIEASRFMQRKKTGAGGLQEVRDALEEAGQIGSFDDLRRVTESVGDQVGQYDPLKISTQGDAKLKQLRAALRADEDAFLEAGGRGAGRQDPADIWRTQPGTEEGYVYHSTNAENLDDIAGDGVLRPHDPDYGTDQSMWPDSGTEPRSYYSPKAETSRQFAPEEGQSVMLRAKKAGADFRSEGGTGDIYLRDDLPASEIEFFGSDGAWHPLQSGPDPLAAEAGKKARAFSRGMHTIDESSAANRIFGNVEKGANIPETLRSLNAAEIRAVKQRAGILGLEDEGIPATTEGREAWEGVVREVLEVIRQASEHAEKKQGMFRFSGERMMTELGRWDKHKGALDEIMGPETAADLRQFAQMLFDANEAPRLFGNPSGTAAQMKVNDDIRRLLENPLKGAGVVVGRQLAEKGAGWMMASQTGKRYLQGQLPFQANQGLIKTLGRAGGQATSRYGANELGIRD